MFKRLKEKLKFTQLNEPSPGSTMMPKEFNQAALPDSLPNRKGESLPGWWRLEIIWTDERGKQFEYFAAATEANERRELLVKYGLVTHLFCAIPTVTWHMVGDGRSTHQCLEPMQDELGELLICNLPEGHAGDLACSWHWADRHNIHSATTAFVVWD